MTWFHEDRGGKVSIIDLPPHLMIPSSAQSPMLYSYRRATREPSRGDKLPNGFFGTADPEG